MTQGLPRHPVVRTRCFHCRAPASVPGQGAKIHKLSRVAKKKILKVKLQKTDSDSGIHLKAHMTGRRITKKRFKGSFSLSHTVTLCKCRKSRPHLESQLVWTGALKGLLSGAGYTNTPEGCQDQNRDGGSVKSWALPMRVTGTPYSRAEMAVHFPVPFCPALSRIFGNRCLPSASWNLRILAVISIRNESSSVLFHSSKACVQGMKESNVRETRVMQETLPNGLILLPCQHWRLLTPEADRLPSRTLQHFSHQLSFMLRVSCVWLQPVDAGLLITRLCFPEPGVPSPRMGLPTVTFLQQSIWRVASYIPLLFFTIMIMN